MEIQPIKPQPNFGIYKGTKRTRYGYHDFGKFKGYNIDIYYDYQSKTKLHYLSDCFKRWIKSKLTYYQGNTKRITRSYNERRL